MKKIILLIIVLLLTSLTYAEFPHYGNEEGIEPEDDEEQEQERARDLDWYDIEEWEFEVCNSTGGTDEVESTTSSAPIHVSQLTITLQSQKTEINIADISNTIYEVAWYIQPLQNEENANYAIRLHNSQTNENHRVLEKTDFDQEGTQGYEAFELETKFDQVQLRYQTSTESGIMTMPIIDSEQGYSQDRSEEEFGDTPTSSEQGVWTDW